MKVLILLFLFVTSSQAKEKIISTAPSITEMLGYFGESDSVAGVSSFCQKPKFLCDKTKIGSMITLDLEKVVRLKPTVVFSLKLSNKSSLGQLHKLGIKTEEFSFNTLSDVKASFAKMGKILKKEKKAKSFVLNIEKSLNKIPTSFRPESFAIITGTALSHGKVASVTLAGEGTYFHDIITYRGHQNIAPKNGITYPVYNLETLIKKNPERVWIIQPKSNDEVLQAWKKLKMLTAVKNNNITVLSGDWAVVPGPAIIELINKIGESY